MFAKIGEKDVTRAIVTVFGKDLEEHAENDVIIVGAGPAGLMAGKELASRGVKTLIIERNNYLGGGLTKKEIHLIAKEYNLSVFNKPAMACLSSRISYGEAITKEKLRRIAEAEIFIKQLLQVTVVRVRHHGNITRIEVLPEEREKLFDLTALDLIVNALKKLGFTYVTLDLQGYRSGSMNESLIS